MSDKEIENQEVELDNNAVAVEEETSNAGTIAAKATDVSRSELMASLVNYANSLGNKEELAAFVAKLPNAKEMTKSNDEIYNSTQQVKGDSGKNKASINSSGAPSEPMKSVKEDLKVLFGEDESLSEDFRLRTEALFEAAVATRVGIEIAKIEEEVEAKYESAFESAISEMNENVDAYLNYAVAEWMQENKLAVESNIRTEVMESFLSGMRDLFIEHYIDVPEDKVDVVESMAAKIEELEAQVNETTTKNIGLSKIVSEKEVKEATNQLSEGLTDTQKEKFVKLVEAVDFSSAEEFVKKASIIKESYFSGKSEVKVPQDQLLNESVDEPAPAERIAPEMQVYASALSRTLKK
jgi:hypothetical protein